MSADENADQAIDPRAHWRQLPVEPARYVEETQRDPTFSTYTVPAVDPVQDFIRMYG